MREKGRLDWEATVGKIKKQGKPLFFQESIPIAAELNLVMSPKARDKLLRLFPAAESCLYPFVSGNTLFYRERKDCLWLPGCPDIFLRNRILLAAEAELNGPDRESWGWAYCGLVPANKEAPKRLGGAGADFPGACGGGGAGDCQQRKYPAAVRLAVVPNVPRVEQCVEQERTDPQLVPICLQCFSGSESGEEFFGENRKRRL